MKQDRKLTIKEQQRKERFNKVCLEMEQKQYNKTSLIVSIGIANIVG